MSNRRRRSIAAACTAALATAAPVLGTTGTVTVTSTEAGKTLQHVGYNMGHYLPGSTTSAWVDYSGVNGYRVWASPGDYEPTGDFGAGINTLTDFDQRKAAVSANPEGNGFIPWSTYNFRFENRTQTGRNKVKLNYILGQLHDRGIDPILQVTRSTKAPEDTWSHKWEQWQHFYAMAYHAAKNYEVEWYQMYNEPDQSSTSLQRTPEDWLVGMKVASDAVRTAIADVNRLHRAGKTPLVANMSGPTTKDGAATIDTYGKPALETNRTDYAGRAVGYDIFDTYDLHRYNDATAGNAYVSDIQTLKAKIPQYNASGQMMPVTYTEYNRRASSSFAGTTDSLDTPLIFSDLASINLKAMSEGVAGLYAFKFNQTFWDHDGSPATPDEPQKTGFFYAQNGGTYDTTGATKGAGVQRLFAKGFKGERPRLATGGAGPTSYDVATSFDAASRNYYLMGVNRAGEGHDLTLDLTGWDVQPGTVISVEEVSAKHHGEVTRLITVPQDKRITFAGQPAQSVWLMTAPSGAPLNQVVLPASHDARVRNSDAASGVSYKTQNYGGLTRARVGRTPDSARFDYASYLQFDTGDVASADVSRAILQVTGQAVSDSGGDPGSILFHVYALANDAWDEDGITWDNAPNLADLDAKLTGVGTDAFPVGHLTFDNAVNEWGVDLTEFVKLHPALFDDGALSFALIREERFANDADATFSYVDLWTKESGSATAPKLLLSVVPEPGSLAVIGGAGLALLMRRRRA